MNIVARPWEPQDLIDDLQMLIDEEPNNYLNHRRTTMCMARDYLKEHFAEPRWISVEERLPEYDQRVLCRYTFGDDGLMYFYQVLDYYATDPQPHFQHTLGDSKMRVTHWMPWPEPPEEEV